MQKLKSILLIDDNLPDNYFHELIIKELDCAEKIISIQDPLKALTYLLTRNDHSRPLPDLIFVDINMPTMNGFELLEAYQQQKTAGMKKPVVVMLSTSLNPADKKRATAFEEIVLFANKPLEEALLIDIITNKMPSRERAMDTEFCD